MLEFLGNIWNWIISNKDAIVTTVTSANFISMIGAIVITIRTSKQSKKNMSVSETLNNSLTANQSLGGTINEVKEDGKANVENVKKLTENVNLLREKQENFEQNVTAKIDAIIEALQTAWSSIKDDNIRTTVAGILTNARYKETNKIEEMKKQMEELKKQLLEQSERMKKQVVDTVDEVKVVMEAKSTDVKTVSRV